MSVDLKPETERLVREELSHGHFESVDEIIILGIRARAIEGAHENVEPPKESFAQFLRRSPLFGSGLNIQRDPDPGRDVTL